MELRQRGARTHRAAQKQANAFGLYDMSGNVWEWVQDTYQINYNGAPTDGSARNGSNDCKVMRGGFSMYSEMDRAAYRYIVASKNRGGINGFHLARTLP
jgi:formylglycine-generating enzyme required for sulfatase activity